MAGLASASSCRTSAEAREAPEPGEIFRQPDLAATLRKLVEAEQQALAAGKDRKEAIMPPTTASTRATSRRSSCAACTRQGGLITARGPRQLEGEDRGAGARSYKGIEVYKLTTWVQGPVMLQALNILENFDLKAMGYNSARYIHTLYQAMNLAFADRDFYYGDPAFPPEEPIRGLLSKEYAQARARS